MLKFTDNNEQAVNTSKPMLKPFDIYEVTYDGISSKEFNGAKDPSAKYHVMEVKFSNESGTFTHNVFMLKEGDEVRKTSAAGYEMASNFEAFRIFVKQLASVLIGEEKYNVFFDKVRKQAIDLSSPEGFQAFIKGYSDLLKSAEGKKTHLKLVGRQDAKGRYNTCLPIFANINRDGELYPSNFIGETLFFSSSEKTKMDAFLKMTPTKMGANTGKAEELLTNNDDLANLAEIDISLDLEL